MPASSSRRRLSASRGSLSCAASATRLTAACASAPSPATPKPPPRPSAGTAAVVRHAASQIANAAVRNMGTIGGSIAYADPGLDFPPALVAVDASVEIAGKAGRRRSAADFFVDWYTTALEPGEIVTAVLLDAVRVGGAAYLKHARVAGDFAIVSAAVCIDDAGPVRAVVGACGPAPLATTSRRAAVRRPKRRRRSPAPRPCSTPAPIRSTTCAAPPSIGAFSSRGCCCAQCAGPKRAAKHDTTASPARPALNVNGVAADGAPACRRRCSPCCAMSSSSPAPNAAATRASAAPARFWSTACRCAPVCRWRTAATTAGAHDRGPGRPRTCRRCSALSSPSGAFQCGFCTPAMLVAAHALLPRNPRPTKPRSAAPYPATSAAAPATQASSTRCSSAARDGRRRWSRA